MQLQYVGGGGGGGWAMSEFAPPRRIEQSFKKIRVSNTHLL